MLLGDAGGDGAGASNERELSVGSSRREDFEVCERGFGVADEEGEKERDWSVATKEGEDARGAGEEWKARVGFQGEVERIGVRGGEGGLPRWRRSESSVSLLAEPGSAKSRLSGLSFIYSSVSSRQRCRSSSGGGAGRDGRGERIATGTTGDAAKVIVGLRFGAGVGLEDSLTGER